MTPEKAPVPVTIRVLVVDDDEDDYLMLKDLLAAIPGGRFKLEWASSYASGREAIGRGAHDVGFLDFRLGPQTGLDLLKESAAAGTRMPLILLTGYGEHEIDLEAMRVGAADYLIKDQVSSALLERAIRYALHRRQMEAQILMQDRLASVGLLASSLAHEIGNPLGVVRGRAEYLGSIAKDDTDVVKTAEIIITQIDRVSKLVRSLLNLARGDEQKSSGSADLREVVNQVVELMGHEFRKNGIELRNKLNGALPVLVKGQPQPLHQVLLNLLVNSIHAIETARARGRKDGHFVELRSESVGNQWVLCVSDSGCGISTANLSNLFKPFFTTKDIGQGTGLGLATSYRIVEAWGGKITAESREGEGATFKVHLPRKG